MTNDALSPRPLDPPSAGERAAQILALADPARLRLMSVLATDPEGQYTLPGLARALGVPEEDASADVRALIDAGLLTSQPSASEPTFTPTADAWIRFGRVLAGTVAESTGSANTLTTATGAAISLPPVIQKIADRLAYRFSSNFSRETVQKYVADSYELLRERAHVTRHLPSLTSRFATDRLGALAAAHGLELNATPEVLFVCVQNAGRSQIAAGILRQLAGNRVHVRTAGSQPASAIDETVVEILDEIGVPVGADFPKPLTDEVVQAADIIITMGCGDACPVYPGRRYLDWPVEDPIGQPLEIARQIRDDIQGRVEGLLRSVGLHPFPSGPDSGATAR